MPVSSLDPSGPALFLQIGGVALAGALVGFALALVEKVAGKRAERLEEEQRSGRRRKRSSRRRNGVWEGAKAES